MPIVDTTSYKCAWCGAPDAFLCHSCFMYTCPDCFLGEHEGGCYHKRKQPVTSQSWSTTKENLANS